MAMLLVCSACYLEGRTNRAERLLSELAPSLRFGETLSDARQAMPELRVRHPGDPTDLETADSAAPPHAVAVVVYPAPAANERARPDAAVAGVEFVMSPDIAAKLRRHISDVFRGPGSLVCAGRSIAETDSVVVWDVDRRGGALLTFPERRLDGDPLVSRLFVYTGAWQPARALSGYGLANCGAST
ncbi:MAG: hypothetical protein JWN53_2342 [Gemmatimonadetes bacterium]|jgi:hypothetical protein|nr:hypothetical protein [Gemmatimonadota bacterium]